MKNNILLTMYFILSTFAVSASSARGGDWGGGGSMAAMRQDFALKRVEQSKLKREHNLNSAFSMWIDNLDPHKRKAIIEKVFLHHIAPQIKRRQLNRNNSEFNEFELCEVDQ